MFGASARTRRSRLALLGAVAAFSVFIVAPAAQAALPEVVIDEFRFHGPSGKRDMYFEFYNPSQTTAVNLNPCDSSGTLCDPEEWVVYYYNHDEGSNGCCYYFPFPANMTIPANGRVLVSAEDYSLGNVQGPDVFQTFTVGGTATDIAHDGGIALYKNYDPAYDDTPGEVGGPNVQLVDQAGFNGSNATEGQFYEGTPIPAPSIASLTTTAQFAWVRRMSAGFPVDTNSNAADFRFVAADAAVTGSQRGAPGPQNSNAPTMQNGVAAPFLFDPGVAQNTAPNRVETPSKLYIRRAIRNRSTDRKVTSLKFRVNDLTTDGTAAGDQAILRLVDAPSLTGVSTTAGNRDLTGLNVEQPPAQPNGGGINSGIVNVPLPAGGLLPGQEVYVQFAFDKARGGKFNFSFNSEAISVPYP